MFGVGGVATDSGNKEDPDPSQSEGDSDTETQIEDYSQMLNELAQDWMNIELNHHVSKMATNAFWSLALAKMSKLIAAKTNQNVRRKTP